MDRYEPYPCKIANLVASVSRDTNLNDPSLRLHGWMATKAFSTSLVECTYCVSKLQAFLLYSFLTR